MSSLFLVILATACSFCILGQPAIKTKFPAVSNAHLGVGIDIGSLSVRTTPFTPASIEAATFFPDAEEYSQFLTQITDQSSFQKTTDMAAELEGSGWGVSVSASASLLSTSTVNSYSVVYTRGAGTVSRIYELDYKLLELTEEAKALLRNDYIGFMRVYGRYMVVSKKAGGSFLGITSVSVTSTSSQSALSLAASLSLSNPYASGSARASFQQGISSSDSQVKISSRFSMTGALPGVTVTSSSNNNQVIDATIEEVNAAFENWQETINSSEYFLTMNLLNMAAVPAISKEIQNNSTAINGFYAKINDFFFKDFSNVYSGLIFCRNSLESFELEAEEAGLTSLFTQHATLIRTRINTLDSYDDATMVSLTQTMGANYQNFLLMPKRCMALVDQFRATVLARLPTLTPLTGACENTASATVPNVDFLDRLNGNCGNDRLLNSWKVDICSGSFFSSRMKCLLPRAVNATALTAFGGNCRLHGGNKSLASLISVRAACPAGTAMQTMLYQPCSSSTGYWAFIRCGRVPGLGTEVTTNLAGTCTNLNGRGIADLPSLKLMEGIECPEYHVLQSIELVPCGGDGFGQYQYTCVKLGQIAEDLGAF